MGIERRDRCSSTARARRYAAGLGVQILNTCTPYQVGNVPTRGEHCAWMESSAVDLLQLGAGRAHQHRRPRERRRRDAHRPHSRTGATTSTRTGRGTHHRRARHRGGVDRRTGACSATASATWCRSACRWSARRRRRCRTCARLKHFGAAASSSGGVEMYHLVGITPEAPTLEQALRRQRSRCEMLRYGEAERRATYEKINATGKRRRGRLRDARLPALHDRADLGSGAADRRPQGARELRAVDLHAARHQVAGRPQRLHRRSSRTPAASS